MTKLNIKELKRKQTQDLVRQCVIELILFILVCIVSYLILLTYVESKTWYVTDPLYQLLHFMASNLIFILPAICVARFLVIIFHKWSDSLTFLNDVVSATEQLMNSSQESINLPTPLRDIEYILNDLKLQVRDKERSALESEQRKNDLIVYLAHDLKTPLTSVIGYLTLLHDEEQISQELQTKYLGISLDKAERLEDLINEFFDITRFNLTNIDLEYSKVNVARVLEQTIFEFHPMFLDKQLTCTLNSPKTLEIDCDVDKIQRVFDNLLRNAVNYCFPNTEIRIDVVPLKNNFLIRFTNKGYTISQDKLERIFEQFYRLDNSRSSRSGGSGLGLAIAKQIVERHKGSITAFSINNVIEFTVTLPVS